jgi:hypothetical protein
MNPAPGRSRLKPALLIASCFVALAFGFPMACVAQAGQWKAGDRVEAYDSGAFQWYSGAITEMSTGKNAGDYLVKWDKWSGSLWVPGKNIRPDGAGTKATAGLDQAAAATTPRLGKYLIMSNGAPSKPPLNLGYFELLAGGTYRVLDMGRNATGEGRYDYDGQTKQVRWIDGPLLANKWNGKFEVSREGKTHTIRFTKGTFGTNSTDSK